MGGVPSSSRGIWYRTKNYQVNFLPALTERKKNLWIDIFDKKATTNYFKFGDIEVN